MSRETKRKEANERVRRMRMNSRRTRSRFNFVFKSNGKRAAAVLQADSIRSLVTFAIEPGRMIKVSGASTMPRFGSIKKFNGPQERVDRDFIPGKSTRRSLNWPLMSPNERSILKDTASRKTRPLDWSTRCRRVNDSRLVALLKSCELKALLLEVDPP